MRASTAVPRACVGCAGANGPVVDFPRRFQVRRFQVRSFPVRQFRGPEPTRTTTPRRGASLLGQHDADRPDRHEPAGTIEPDRPPRARARRVAEPRGRQGATPRPVTPYQCVHGAADASNGHADRGTP